ncbi:MAG: AhpC/TSA family protein [Duncaniella sp.]|nr:AhpC/TSA family protein [Duncaniella sp.]
MDKKFIFALSAGLLAVSACTLNAQSNYSVTASVPAEKNNTMAYLLNWDNGQKVDSVIVAEGQAKFSGNSQSPFIGRLVVDGARGPIFIVEEGNVTVSPDGVASGTPLNAKMETYAKRMKEIVDEYQNIDQNDSTLMPKAKALQAEYDGIPSKAYAENKGNTLGLYYFLKLAYEMDLAQLDAAIAADANLASSGRVQTLRKSLLARAETSEGKHYKDFSITYNGKTEKLSDYVKPGRYTLVDFWASWCGPCIRQTKVIKELYAKYKDKGLDVLGVAVWDEPENTLKAIKSHGLDWPCIINGQNVPTDLYGITGIPCIILINPDGVIVSRDKQSQALIDDVDKAMSTYEPQALVIPAATSANDTAAVKTDTNVIF